MQDSKSNQTHAKARSLRRRMFTSGVAVVGTAGLAATVMLPAGTALAAYQVTPNGSSVASVVVGSAISLTSVTATLTLGTGVPGDSITDTPAPVTMDVYTNNASGYNVTVQAATALTSTGTDTIPASDLSVEDNDTANTATDQGAYVPITAKTDTGAPAALVVYAQGTRSATGGVGDLLTESWEFNKAIPDVNTGTYSTTLDFIASNNP